MRSIPSAVLLAAVLSIIAGCESPPAKLEATPLVAAPPPAPNSMSREVRIARAKALELPTAYVPPPGDALSHHASGFVKVMCSAVFITGLDPDFAAANIGYIVPLEQRAKLGKPVVDRANRTVSVAVPNGPVRTAKYVGSQGCVTLADGESSLHFTPVEVKSKLPPAPTQKWPMGDLVDGEPLPPGIDAAKLKQAVDAAFEPAAGMTAAYVVTWKGRIIAERYADGITAQTPLESWSMGKTVLATLMGILIKDGVYDLWQPAPIPEWRTRGDDRAKIRIADLLRMSSGLRSIGTLDAEPAPDTYSDHWYLYTGGVDTSRYAATRPLQWPPGTVGRYRNVDVSLTNYLVRAAVEKRRQDYLSFPQRALYDRIGMRSIVVETDPYGNYLFQGYDLASARDWARLGNLYLQDGMWNGERILSREYVEFVRTPSPAWADDARPVYGGFVWLNRANWWPGPEDSYAMAGAGGQATVIIPTHDLVVVRMGHWRGEEAGTAAANRALKLLLEAVPQAREIEKARVGRR
jgi:CubicO group peptidase (beta-lactamase class C family)